jgi:hypothetical protein
MLPFAILIWRFLRSTFHALEDPSFRPIFTLVMLLLAIGTVFYHQVEGWRWFDSLYFCVITLATVGYGDFTPKTDLGKGFTMLYLILGIGLLLSFVNAIGARTQQRTVSRRRSREERSNSEEGSKR